MPKIAKYAKYIICGAYLCAPIRVKFGSKEQVCNLVHHQLHARLCQFAFLLLLEDREAAVQVDQEIDPCEQHKAISNSKKKGDSPRRR